MRRPPACCIEKLMLQGIEVHQSSKPDAWVILMNQPFAGLVKELFEPQKYPALSQRPYDVTGWTLPYQMGVEVHAVTTPLDAANSSRGSKEISSLKGFAAPFNHDANASFRAVNQILAANGSVAFAGDDIARRESRQVASLDSILAENHLKMTASPTESRRKAASR